VLFAVSALFPKFYAVAWITFVPFLLGLQQCRSARHAYAFGVLAGFVAFSLSMYWMAEFVQLFKGYSTLHSAALASLYWIYCAQIFAVIAVVTHYARRANTVLWVYPTTLTLVFAFFPTLFPWHVGDSQSEFLVAIQATDITGVSGLDFIIGIVTVLIAQALFRKQVFFQRDVIAAYAFVAAWFVYGVVSLTYWDRAISSWDTLKVGIVQPDEPPTIGIPGPRPSFSLGYPIEMDLTEQLVAAGAEVVIWPELRNKQYHGQPFVQTAYQRQIKNLATPLLFQSFEQVQSEDDGLLTFNTAVWIDENGNESDKYRKIKRIAVAEYLPLFGDSEAIKTWLRQYLGEFFGDYSIGLEPKRFDVGNVSLEPFICYEVLFPQFVADSARVARGDIFIAQSNNGWFGNSRAPYPHMGASILRAVENRRPLVHAMNNGLGGVALPSGRTVLRTEHRAIAGYLLDVPYQHNSVTTLYGRFPYWFVAVISTAMALMLLRAKRSV